MGRILMQLVMSWLGVWGFAILFRVSGRLSVCCGVLGSMDWILYLWLTEYRKLPYAAAVVIAIFALVVVSRAVAARIGTPATVFVVTGIFPLVPGAGIYYTAYYLVVNDSEMAGVKGIETVVTAFCIAIGIILANTIPQKWFRIFHRPLKSGGNIPSERKG